MLLSYPLELSCSIDLESLESLQMFRGFPWLEDTSNAGVVETAARIMEILDRRKVPRNSGFWDQKPGAIWCIKVSMDPSTLDAYADTEKKDLRMPIHVRRIHIRRHVYVCRSKGPCRDCPLQLPQGFQHETLRKFFLVRESNFCLGERFSEHETLRKINMGFAKDSRK
jgi:hypothetical protein